VLSTTEEAHYMALFMDVHNIEGGVSAGDVAGAHKADLATQEKYGVDEDAGKIFCLIEAANADDANTVHREAQTRWLMLRLLV
jgi:hypothetical protein